MVKARTERLQPAKSEKLDVLEFGVYCQNPDGPIVPGAGYRVLGYSQGFPSALIKICNPKVLDLGEERNRYSSGTVLRPVCEDRNWSVLYRMGLRSEAGEDAAEHSRQYLLARYLALEHNLSVSPLDIWRAMEPLRGLTEKEADALCALPILADSAPPAGTPDRFSETFLPQALIYTISGVPVRIENASEEFFFRLVDQLWQQLPDSLRTLLSAGWNVGPRLSGVLALSAGAPGTSPIPFFDAASGSWHSGHREEEFSTLLPGRIYCHYQFGQPQVPESELNAICHEPDLPLPQLPDFSNDGTRSAFRREGMQRRDHYLLQRMEAYLEGSGPDEPPPGLGNVIKDPASTSKLLAMLLGGKRQERIFRLAWEALELDGSFLDQASEADGIGWIAAIHKGEMRQALEQLPAKPPTVASMPPPILERWRELMDRSIRDLEILELHRKHLLTHTAGIYQDWAAEHMVELVCRFMQRCESRRELVKEIGIEKFNPKIGQFLALIDEQRSPGEAELLAIQSWTDAEKRLFALLLEETLSALRPEDQLMLYGWAKGLPRSFFSDPWLLLAKDGEVTPSQLEQMMNRARQAPPELSAKIAHEALRMVRELRMKIEEEPDAWAHILAQWPQPLPAILVDVPFLRSGAAESVPRDRVWPQSREEAQERIRYWFSGPDRGGEEPSHWQETRARGLFESCRSLPAAAGSPMLAVDMCRVLAGRSMPANQDAPEEHELQLATNLLRAARLSEIKPDIENLWTSATEGWQIRLLLEVIPRNTFSIAPAQLACLIPYRKWVREHLKQSQYSIRRNQLAAASFDFHQTRRYGEEGKFWKYDFKNVALWAAFSGLNSMERGDLAQALAAYAPAYPEKASCCLLHLQTYPDQQALREVLTSFVIPLVREWKLDRGEESEMDILFGFARAVGNPAMKSGMFKPKLSLELSPDEGAESGKREENAVTIPSWAFPLLWTVARNKNLESALKRIHELMQTNLSPTRKMSFQG